MRSFGRSCSACNLPTNNGSSNPSSTRLRSLSAERKSFATCGPTSAKGDCVLAAATYLSNSSAERRPSASLSELLMRLCSTWSATESFHLSRFVRRYISGPTTEPLLSLSTSTKSLATGLDNLSRGLRPRASTKRRLKAACCMWSVLTKSSYSSAASMKRLRISTPRATSSMPSSTPFLSASVLSKSCTIVGLSTAPHVATSNCRSSATFSLPSASASASLKY
mmetsp:Transcript_4427/g.10348  ORF Transcript_4427/g.10348 Transcript_4427/m.10348 type:complete len:223 (-) Transcript_4427:865-1533(-)